MILRRQLSIILNLVNFNSDLLDRPFVTETRYDTYIIELPLTFCLNFELLSLIMFHVKIILSVTEYDNDNLRQKRSFHTLNEHG